MSARGAIIALAYPDEFVKATEAGYNLILRKIGIVNANLVKAGHAAALIVQPNGRIHYTDFGRYITPLASGRARTWHTDPDVHLDIKAQFSNLGVINNLTEIMDHLQSNPQITHSTGNLYAGVFYDVDIQRSLTFAWRKSLQGSMDYGPFAWKGSNCARFVLGLLWNSTSWKGRFKLLIKSLPSPMPLDLIMCAEVYNRFECKRGEVYPYSQSRLKIWSRLFERPTSKDLLHIDSSQLFKSNGTWLTGIGDGSWFELENAREDRLLIVRRNSRGHVVFRHWFDRPMSFKPKSAFEFIFDCNAEYCTVKQDGTIFKCKRLHHLDASDSKAVGTGSFKKLT